MCDSYSVKKILILTAGFGDGHNAAARNVADALELISDEVKVEVLDVFQSSLGLLNDVVQKAYQGLARLAPGVWNGIHSMMDNGKGSDTNLLAFGNLKNALEQILAQSQPDCVISTYPTYAHVIREIYRDHSERPFRFITVVTDSISVNSSWFRAPCDLYCVPNEATAEVLRKNGVPAEKVKAFGFPVNPVFAEKNLELVQAPKEDGPIKVLYIINNGQKKSGKGVDRLLEIPRVHLTITVGRDAELKEKLFATGGKIRRPRQSAGLDQPNAAVDDGAPPGRDQSRRSHRAGSHRGPLPDDPQPSHSRPGGRQRPVGHANSTPGWWRRKTAKWRNGSSKLLPATPVCGRSGATIWPKFPGPTPPCASPNWPCTNANWTARRNRLFESNQPGITRPGRRQSANGVSDERMLLCDFHIHTNYSDGKIARARGGGFLRPRGFDCICITDHLGDPRRLIGKLSKLLNLTIGPEQMDEYFDVIERERRRAWRKYNMLVMTGMEFNKDGFTQENLRPSCWASTSKRPSIRRWICRRPSRKFTRKAGWPSPRIRTS